MRLFISFLILFILNSPLSQAQCSGCDAFLGIYTNNISKSKAEKLDFEYKNGSYVSGIIGNTAAEKAGLQPFDYIYGIDEYRTNSGRSLTSILNKYESGDEVVIHFYRNGKQQSKELRLGSRSDSRKSKRKKTEDPFLGVEQMYKDKDHRVDGVRVNVIKNSSAEAMGLEDEDIITHINGFPILDWQDMGTAIDMMEVGQTMKVNFVRNSERNSLSGEIKSLAATKYKSYSNSDSDSDSDAFDFDFDSDNDNKNRKNWSFKGSDNASEIKRQDISDFRAQLSDNISRSALSKANLSSDNNLNVNNLKLSANDKANQFELTFNLPTSGTTSVNIFNEQGRNIYNYDLGKFSGAFEDTIDIAQNGTGAYYLEIKQDNKSLVKKIELDKR
jgi:membrane-associated protease RseP (regulator of RpoE activity)